ncbi:hypothetical protein [Peribacillus frigoritolerans]|uniref:Uncharacterized protein n=1 Tax=Peribacillus castrilensis TaxID=2897690 RepID=A0AAW9NC24_9BACI|nr:hypothetical protein [Peribacillus castrilensis]
MFNLKSKTFWKYALIILLFPAVVNFLLFQYKLPWVFGTADNWLSFWGNYTGGLVSAFVAYVVAYSQIEKQQILANSQIKKQQQIELHNRIIAQLPSLMRIRLELSNYSMELRKVKQEREAYVAVQGEILGKKIYFPKPEYSMPSLEEKMEKYEHRANLGRYTIDLFDKNNYILLEKIENDDLHLKLITCFNFYDDFSKAVTIDLVPLEKKIEEHRPGPKTTTSLDMNKVLQSSIARTELVDYISKKQIIWKKFFEESQLSIFEQVLDEVNKEIADIQKRKEKENSTILSNLG